MLKDHRGVKLLLTWTIIKSLVEKVTFELPVNGSENILNTDINFKKGRFTDREIEIWLEGD